MAFYAKLMITTVEERRRGLKVTEDKEYEYRLKTFDNFVGDWYVEYFFNPAFQWDLRKICEILPGLEEFIDHVDAFVDAGGKYFLLMQPYDHVNPEKFCRQNGIEKYVKFWKGGYHNEHTYSIVISGDFLTYVENHIAYGETWKSRIPDAASESFIATIDEVH